MYHCTLYTNFTVIPLLVLMNSYIGIDAIDILCVDRVLKEEEYFIQLKKV